MTLVAPAHSAESAAVQPARASDRVAFVLQGGGALASPQVGMLRALAEAGIRADLLIGSSAGALNAVAFASDPSAAGLDRLASLWLGLRRKQVARFSMRTMAGALSGRGDGLLSSAAMSTLLRSGVVVPLLEEAALPAHVVVTDFSSGEPVVLSRGDTVTALLASSAFPGLYPPVASGSRLFVDGGVSADVPIVQAEALGATVSYVLPAAGSQQSHVVRRGPLSVAYRALGQVLDGVTRRDLAAATGQVHVLPTPTSNATNPIDFRGTRRLIDEGYRLAGEWLRLPHSAAVGFAGASALRSSNR